MSAVAKFQPRYRADNADLALDNWVMLPEASADWVNALRLRAKKSLQETGLPTQNLERWKYTNLPAKIKKIKLDLAIAEIEMSGMTDFAYSFPKGMLNFPEWAKTHIERAAPSNPKYGDMMLWEAGNAYIRDGFVLDVPTNTHAEKPLNITLTGHKNSQTNVRQIIRLGAGSEFTLIEYQNGAGEYWTNIVSQIVLERGAKFYHYRFQENSETSVITHNTHVELEEGAEYHAFTLTTGAGQSRNQIHADLLGANAVCRLDGITMLDGTENADTTITVEHHSPNCNSYQDYRNVVTDKAVGTFQGKVHVHKAAQKTDGFQMAKSLLLSSQATINTKPELEIYADDVKCSHGATTGRLDADALFYLQARGIPEMQARNLLIQAFVSEVIENISNDEVREQAALVVANWLHQSSSTQQSSDNSWLAER